MAPSDAPQPKAASRPRPVNIALWVVQILLGAAFLFWFGLNKILGTEDDIRLFEDIGMGQWMRYVTGVLEMAGGLGLLIPRLSGLAALGLVGVMAGATLTNLLVPGYTPLAGMTVALGVVLGLVAWGRWPETRSLLALLRR